MNKIIIIYSYYIVWFGSLILASNNLPWLALLLSIGLSTVVLYCFIDLSQAGSWKKFILYLTSLGYCIDCISSALSYIHFNSNPWQPYLAPPWILGLWFNFSVLCIGLVEVLELLRSYLWLIALFGFPAAYLGGIGFHVAYFTPGNYSSIILGLVWMLLFPLFCRNFLFKERKSNNQESGIEKKQDQM